MKTAIAGANKAAASSVDRRSSIRRGLLVCGILSSLLYVVYNVVGPMQWEHYDLASQSVSELASIGAPSRPLMIPLGIAYEILVTAFGMGVWMSAARNRPLQISAAMIVIYGLIGLSAPFFPMQPPGTGASFTGTMHLIATAVTVLLMFLAMAFGAAALGKRFRVYSIVTVAVLLVFGALGASQAPRVDAGLPTPWLGIVERINIGVFLLWIIVLAIALLRRPTDGLGAKDR